MGGAVSHAERMDGWDADSRQTPVTHHPRREHVHDASRTHHLHCSDVAHGESLLERKRDANEHGITPVEGLRCRYPTCWKKKRKRLARLMTEGGSASAPRGACARITRRSRMANMSGSRRAKKRLGAGHEQRAVGGGSAQATELGILTESGGDAERENAARGARCGSGMPEFLEQSDHRESECHLEAGGGSSARLRDGAHVADDERPVDDVRMPEIPMVTLPDLVGYGRRWSSAGIIALHNGGAYILTPHPSGALPPPITKHTGTSRPRTRGKGGDGSHSRSRRRLKAPVHGGRRVVGVPNTAWNVRASAMGQEWAGRQSWSRHETKIARRHSWSWECRNTWTSPGPVDRMTRMFKLHTGDLPAPVVAWDSPLSGRSHGKNHASF
ncbi:hypothetical protein DFH09DRAFT_1077894 [Mycena vulgaris]|nr:hypothetical protein DFH09DRAFT_1077894 [Mycena vulgaris]